MPAEKVKKIRQSNIELLRIVSMLLIIGHHLAIHSGFDFSKQLLNMNNLWLQFILMGGKIGVNLFLLISGYFLINSRKVKLQKAVKLWLQIFFYSIALYFLSIQMGLDKFSTQSFIEHLFPITFDIWWFASCYFLLFLMHPFLNRMINSQTYRQNLDFLLLALFLGSIIPALSGTDNQVNSFIWFMIMYITGGFLRKYINEQKIKPVFCFLIAAVLIFLNYFSYISPDLYQEKLIGFQITFYTTYQMNGLLTYLISIFIFLGFSRLQIGYSRQINAIASTTFGIYLLHDFEAIRNWLWRDYFVLPDSITHSFFILKTIGIIILVFGVCMIIDLVRNWIVEHLLHPFIHVICLILSLLLNIFKAVFEKLIIRFIVKKA